jgi:hypothetical protein
MSVINKELYDALIQANVSDDLATKAAKSVSEENTTQLNDINQIKQDVAVIQTRLSIVEKLQWIVVAGIVALLIKSFVAI